MNQLGPYGRWAMRYAEVGLFAIPLPPNSKSAPPVGYTKRGSKPPSLEQIRRWSTPGVYVESGGRRWEACRGNLAWALPGDSERELHGLDVDAYDGHDGGLSLRELERLLGGPVEWTWSVTSRRDGVSGIRIFEVPAGLKWPGDLHGLTGYHGIDTIRHGHRYVVLPPSVHPDGPRYRWRSPAGPVKVRAFLDSSEGFPVASARYVQLLTSGEQRPSEVDVVKMSRSAKSAWLEARPDGAPCAEMELTTAEWCSRIEESWTGGIHDAALRGAMVLMGLAAMGHAGVLPALDRLREAFAATRQRAKRRTAEAASEWGRIVGMGVPKAAAEAEALGVTRRQCRCESSAKLEDKIIKAGWRRGTAMRITNSLNRKRA